MGQVVKFTVSNRRLRLSPIRLLVIGTEPWESGISHRALRKPSMFCLTYDDIAPGISKQYGIALFSPEATKRSTAAPERTRPCSNHYVYRSIRSISYMHRRGLDNASSDITNSVSQHADSC
jgi:hypothetical protein